MTTQKASEMGCATCALRAKADANPKSFMARLWRFHTKFCPGWKAYQRALAAEGKSDPA
ncbi:MAG: hypothetical protein JXN59_05320 [Anaerolineae bacterium]|nr:hypothetical protein [Anaerolineae bacterium]